MKIGCRIIGAVLCFAGLVFLSIALTSTQTKPDSVLMARDWSGVLASAAFSIIFLGAGWYFLRLDIDSLSDDGAPPKIFAVFLARHQGLLKYLANAGFLVSLVLFCLVCFGAAVPPQVWVASWVMLVMYVCCFSLAGREKSKQRPAPNVQPIVTRLISWLFYGAMLVMMADAIPYKGPVPIAQHRLARSASLMIMMILFGVATRSLGATRSTEAGSEPSTR